MRKGQLHSEETRLKMRLAKLGKPNPNKGKHLWADKPHPNLGKPGHNRVKEITKICVGCQSSFDIKPRMSKRYCSRSCSNKNMERRTNSGSFVVGMTSWNKGLAGKLPYIPHPKMRQYVGEKHWSWKGGPKMWKRRNERGDSAYQGWVLLVKARDKNLCQFKNDNCNGYNTVHHILPWRKYPEERYNVNNGIVLCQYHHPLKRSEEKKLIPVLQEIVRTKLN